MLLSAFGQRRPTRDIDLLGKATSNEPAVATIPGEKVGWVLLEIKRDGTVISGGSGQGPGDRGCQQVRGGQAKRSPVKPAQ
jgi:hypothetical protein